MIIVYAILFALLMLSIVAISTTGMHKKVMGKKRGKSILTLININMFLIMLMVLFSKNFLLLLCGTSLIVYLTVLITCMYMVENLTTWKFLIPLVFDGISTLTVFGIFTFFPQMAKNIGTTSFESLIQDIPTILTIGSLMVTILIPSVVFIVSFCYYSFFNKIKKEGKKK